MTLAPSCSDGGGPTLGAALWPGVAPHACSDLLQENPASQPRGAGELHGAQCRGQEAPSQWLSWCNGSTRAWSLLPRVGCPQLWKFCSIPSSPLSGCLGRGGHDCLVSALAASLPQRSSLIGAWGLPPFYRHSLSPLPSPQINPFLSFPGGSGGKESACNTADLGWVPGSGRSHGRGNGNAPQYSCVGNPMDRGVFWATVHRVAKSQIWLKWLTLWVLSQCFPRIHT